MQRAGGSAVDKFIQRENLALLRRRLADPALTDAQRQTILRLLTEERAKGMTAETNSLGLWQSKLPMKDLAVEAATNDQGLI